jgi:hypothetical protein
MPHVPPDAPKPDRRDVKITVFASLGPDDPLPDCLEALRRLMTEHPDRVEVYDVTDTGVDEFAAAATAALEEGCVVEIPEPTDLSVAGRAPEHRQYVRVTRGRLRAPIRITGTDGAEKIVVTDVDGETRWLFLTDVRPAAAPSS